MVKHIVTWKFKETADAAGKKANIAKAKAMLEGLAQRITVVRNLEVGVNVNTSDGAYDLALYAEFASLADLEIYQKHPEHVKAADYLKTVRDVRVVVDYVI